IPAAARDLNTWLMGAPHPGDRPDRAGLIQAVVLGGEGGTLTLLGPIDGQGEFLKVAPRVVGYTEDYFGVYDGADLIPVGRELIGALDLVNSEWRRMVGVHVAPIFETAVRQELARAEEARAYDDWRQRFDDWPMTCRSIWPACDMWPDGQPRDAFQVEGNLDQVRAVMGHLAFDHQMQLDVAAHEPFAMLISRDGSQRFDLPHPKSTQRSGVLPQDRFQPVGPHQIQELEELQNLGMGTSAPPHRDPGVVLLGPTL
ncbi:hypothetical protein, partial [Deinococcus marmoris]